MSTTHREALEALRADALEIFDDPECPQAVRDAIEWYHSSILVALSRPEPQAGEAKLREALRNLVEQISKCSPIDDHDHDFKMNAAYLRAKEIL